MTRSKLWATIVLNYNRLAFVVSRTSIDELSHFCEHAAAAYGAPGNLHVNLNLIGDDPSFTIESKRFLEISPPYLNGL